MLTVARDEDGARIEVAELSALKRQGLDRPKCFCLACDRQLDPRLGEKKRHHFGHRPTPETEQCWATSREGELHLAAKRLIEVALLEACAKQRTVVARITCAECKTSGAFRPEVVHLTPDCRVLIEYWGDPRKVIKPDVQVVDAAGSPVLFVEVRVTHASTDAKVRFVREMGVPMVEVEGLAVSPSLVGNPVFDCIAHQNIELAADCVECDAKRRAQEAAAAVRQAEAERAAARQARQQEAARRLEELRPAAEQRVRDRRLAEPVTAVVAWCHIHVFVAEALVAADRLLVQMTWAGKATELALLKGGNRPVRTWTGTTGQLLRVYRGEMRQAAKHFAEALCSSGGTGAVFDTFSGFRTKAYRDSPPTYTRVPAPGGKGWITAYPWRDLARHFTHSRLCTLVREHRWVTTKSLRGVTCVEARGVDDFFRANRAAPSLARPKPEADLRWSMEVEEELERMFMAGEAPTLVEHSALQPGTPWSSWSAST
jgi:hypothetical protein